MQPIDEMTPLTPEEQIIAKQKLAEKHIPLAYKIAAGFSKNWRWLKEDFESEALLALVEAANTFDPVYKVQFVTFATIRIKGALMTFRRKMTQSRLAESQIGEEENAGETKKEWTQTKASSNLNGEEVAEYLYKREIASYTTDELGALGALEELKHYIKRLPKKHRVVVSAVYLEGRDVKEVARECKCSINRLRAIHREAVNMLTDGDGLPDPSKCRRRRANRVNIRMPEPLVRLDDLVDLS